MTNPELDDDFQEWEAEVQEHLDDERIARLTQANAAWSVPSLRPGRDERALWAVLRFGRWVRRVLRLR